MGHIENEVIEIVGQVAFNRLRTHAKRRFDLVTPQRGRFEWAKLSQHPLGTIQPWESDLPGNDSDYRTDQEIRDTAIQRARDLGVGYTEINTDKIARVLAARKDNFSC